jgi:acetoacetyl-CoA reductase
MGGIGSAICHRLHREGFTVIAGCGPTRDWQKWLDEQKALGYSFHASVGNVADWDSTVAAFAKAKQQHGPIDVLVNNAGWELRSPIETAHEDEVRAQFETNVFGTLRVTRAVLPKMRERRAGTIVNLSSIGGVVSVPYGGYYSASKHALEAISEAMHYELHSFGVRIIIIEPGGFPTGFSSNVAVGKAFTPGTPYFDLNERFDAKLRLMMAPGGVAQDPADVATTIYAAVNDPAPKLRYLVGADAQMIAGVRKQLDFEGFEGAMRNAMDWRD